jgi:hypothetical protein
MGSLRSLRRKTQETECKLSMYEFIAYTIKQHSYFRATFAKLDIFDGFGMTSRFCDLNCWAHTNGYKIELVNYDNNSLTAEVIISKRE